VAANTRAANVEVEVEGLNDEMRDAVRSTLPLADYGKRDISPAELRASFKNADEQIRKALEPFGFYDVEIDKKLTGDASTGWKAHFQVTPGKPAVVRNTNVEVRGEGRQQRRVAEAVAGFAPRVGDRLDHATYEASKQVIDSSLRGSGLSRREIRAAPRDGAARTGIRGHRAGVG
jgi:translocation and assembly module TamA